MNSIMLAVRAIEAREPGESFSYREIAKRYGVVRSTLTRAHRRAIGTEIASSNTTKLLSDQEEIELLQHIKILTERGLPPTRQMIQRSASRIAHRQVSISWVDRFTRRKGSTTRSKRIFNRPLWESRSAQQALQDGSRDWVSLIACVCADGRCLDPALIYPSTVGNIQDRWVDNIDLDQHHAFVTSTESGWSNNDIGLAWLEQVFDRLTKQDSGRWRLLIVDGHGSHVTDDFIAYCDSNRILLAIYPPHSTHRLQPLDVSIFKPLSTAYLNELTSFITNSQGLLSMTMGDFYQLFYKAWSDTMRPELIMSAFAAVGIWPMDPQMILARFDQARPSDRNTPDSESSRLSASDWRKINRQLRALVDVNINKEARQLSQIIHHISIQNQLL